MAWESSEPYGISITTHHLPIDIMKQGSSMIPGKATFELANLAVIAVALRTVSRFEFLLDIIQKSP
jgi:hypothetical protein